jgi:HAD superfamily hydrolase (TIGR01509 family)
MRWIDDYQVFLFDFDGLLVNTEEVHYNAYQLACREHGWELPWDFKAYCTMAHYRAEALQEAMVATFPDINKFGWDTFYKLKTDKIYELVLNGQVQLMDGVKELLLLLQEEGKKRCVVTHSPDRLVSPIREHNPILNTIPIWITREFYSHPKPNPECYQKAIERLATADDRIIGFEDTPRGMRALMKTRAKAVIVSEIRYPEIEEFVSDGASYDPNFKASPSNRL